MQSCRWFDLPSVGLWASENSSSSGHGTLFESCLGCMVNTEKYAEYAEGRAYALPSRIGKNMSGYLNIAGVR